jgi:hypothetical protein
VQYPDDVARQMVDDFIAGSERPVGNGHARIDGELAPFGSDAH